MAKFHKDGLSVSRISAYVILVVILAEMYHTMAEKQTSNQETNIHNRRKRQAGDIILMGYKAQKALKGTTRPSEFFRRIGKKWNGPQSLTNTEFRPDDYGGGLYIDDELVEDW